jgi:Sec-independent protein translocase protein TatA
MFRNFIKEQREARELRFAHEFAESIKLRLLTTTVLGLITVVTTGVTAVFGYYTRDLPETIRELTSSVTDLRKAITEQVEINEEQDDRVDRIESRVTQLEQGK